MLSMLRYSPEELPPDRREVDWDERQSAAGPVKLETYSLGPCIGLASHDRSTGFGQLAHILPGGRGELINEFFEELQDEAPRLSEIGLWVCGGRINGLRGTALRECVREARVRVARHIAALGPLRDSSSPDVRWNNATAAALNMALDCGEGTCQIKIDNPYLPLDSQTTFEGNAPTAVLPAAVML